MTAPIEIEFIEKPEREAGVFVSSFVGLEPFSYDDKATGERQDRWRWMFVDEHDEPLDTLTTAGFYGPGGRPTQAFAIFAGILGRDPKSGDKPAESYGKLVQCVYGANKGGKLTVTNVLPYKAPKGT